MKNKLTSLLNYLKRLLQKTFVIFQVQGIFYTVQRIAMFLFHKLFKLSNMNEINYPGDYLSRYKIFQYEDKFKLKEDFNPLVSIIIPTKDNVIYLEKAVASVQYNNYQNYELIIINNNSSQKDSFTYFEKLKQEKNIKILDHNVKFNFAEINNFAVEHSKGELLLFLNNDVESLNSDWLEKIVEKFQDPEVGIVGTELLYPDHTIQHAGVAYFNENLSNVTQHLFSKMNEVEFNKYLNFNRKVSGVTGACLMIRKSDFISIGNFDENLSIVYQDLDLCFKILEKNKLIIFITDSKLIHYESATRKKDFSDEEFQNWLYFVKKWRRKLITSDPYA